MSPRHAAPLPFDRPFTAHEAHAAGLTRDALQHRLRTGEILRLRRGVYAPSRPLTSRERITAAVLTAPAGAVLAMEAAALLLGMPLPHSRGLGRVDLFTVPGTPPGGGRPQPEIRLHYDELPPTQVTTVDGWLVTSLARTAVDLACGQRLPRALVTLDHARRVGVTLQALYDARYSASGRRGVAILDQALRECSPLAESPLESMSRGEMVLAGLPRPTLQMPVVGRSGKEYRADFYFPQARLIGESDGIGKYSEEGGPFDPDAARERFVREKAREDDLRAAGHRFERWTWDEIVRSPDVVMRRLRSHLR